MSREKLSFTNSPTIAAGELKLGEEVNGKFLGIKTIPVTGRNGKFDSTLIRLLDRNGVEFGLWSNSSINQRVLDLVEGDVYAFVALGEQENEKTGRMFDAFDVFRCTADELTFSIDDVEPEAKPEPVAAGKTNGRTRR